MINGATGRSYENNKTDRLEMNQNQTSTPVGNK